MEAHDPLPSPSPGAPLFHHELVRQALVAAATDAALEAPMLDLLAALAASGEVSATQAARGADRFVAALDDLVLDCPPARAAAGRLAAGLAARGVVAGEGKDEEGVAAGAGA